jgi:hypothetical protein
MIKDEKQAQIERLIEMQKEDSLRYQTDKKEHEASSLMLGAFGQFFLSAILAVYIEPHTAIGISFVIILAFFCLSVHLESKKKERNKL